MKQFFSFLAVFAAIPLTSATTKSFSNEQLHYSINWPSGLSLGEAQLHGSRTKADSDAPARLDLGFDIDAAVPGFEVSDRFRSAATENYCSLSFEKKIQQGKKRAEETTTFDQEGQTATRETTGGGKTDLKTPACAKDALAYLYFLRHELSLGRLPPAQTVYFGAGYQIRVEFAGTQRIKVSDQFVEADRINASLKGQSSDVNFEVYFLKDSARTPILARVPLAMGTFSMELATQP